MSAVVNEWVELEPKPPTHMGTRHFSFQVKQLVGWLVKALSLAPETREDQIDTYWMQRERQRGYQKGIGD